MKTNKYIAILALALAGTVLCACHEDEPDPKSIFETTSEARTPFDNWLDVNYVEAFNMDFKYRMDDIESDFSKNLTPADLEQSMRLATIIKHAWLDAYVEVAGVDFMREHAPAILNIIGSASWNGDGTITLGTAEGGLKITLYMTNWLDPKNIAEMNEYFFKTMHHEFTHIMHQDVNFPQEYNLISASDYRPSGWNNRRAIADYASLGFVTSYAGSQPREDITEMTACYVTFTDKQWSDVFAAAGEEGTAKLNEKLKIMKNYMKDTWNIDMDELRTVVSRRMNEVLQMELLRPEWVASLAKVAALPKADFRSMLEGLESTRKEAIEFIDEHPALCHVHDAALLDLIDKNLNAPVEGEEKSEDN